MGDVTPLLLLLCAAVTVSSAVDLQKRIILGQPCVRQYHVKFIGIHGNLICGGSLISDKWILTAAHCLKWGMIAHVPIHQGLNHTELITTQPEIHKDKKNKRHDIMLLELSKPLTQIQPVPLPDVNDCKDRPTPGANVSIAGFGARSVCLPSHRRDKDISAQLLCGEIQVIDCQNFRQTTLNKHENQFFKIVNEHSHWICAQSPSIGKGKVDVAPGDSGGGVEYNGKIYGVISAMGNSVVAYDEPALFMDVCKYMPWIEKTVGIGILNKIRNAIKKRLR